jgi:tetratricopeptide (TPR) repeat protein
LIYLYFRLDQTRQAQEVAEDILRDFPSDRDTLKMLVNLYLDRGQHALALKTARAFNGYFPEDPEVRYLLARVYKSSRQPREAREILRQLKASTPPGEPFLHEEELALLSAQSGDWPSAITSYRSLLSQPDLEPETQAEVRQQLDLLYRANLPQLFGRFNWVKPKSGRILRSQAIYSQPLESWSRVGLKLERDDITVDRAQFLRQNDSDRYDAQAGFWLNLSPWQVQLWAGGGTAGPIFSGQVSRALAEEIRLTLTAAGNQRSIDSLLIESLDGREDKISLLWNSTFGGDTFLDLELRGRRVTVSDETLGYGLVATASLARSIPNFPDLKYGYRARVSTFSLETDDPSLVDDVADSTARPIDRELLVSNMVQPINLHGLFLSWEHSFHSRLLLRADVGTDYSLERADIGYSGEMGLSFFPLTELELILEGGYSTSAETSNVESELFQLSFAVRYFF